ncbi:MAG: hypothetical protein PHS24_00210 [Bacilli bacterium]|nr:hypothetical protein [Bacilli bacterium]
MKEITKQITEIIKKPMEELGIIVHSVDYVTKNNYKFLKITLDKVNGIDLDTIVEVTNIINPIINKQDLIKEEYILDISSKERG